MLNSTNLQVFTNTQHLLPMIVRSSVTAVRNKKIFFFFIFVFASGGCNPPLLFRIRTRVECLRLPTSHHVFDNYESVSKAMSTPGDGIAGKQVDVHVVVCLDDKLCLLTEGGHPQLPEHVLVGQVVVGVMETTLSIT